MLQKLSKAPKVELGNKFLKAPQALKKSSNSEMMSVAIKMERELADHEKLHQGLEATIKLRLKEAVDKLLGNSPAAEVELI